MTTKKIKYPYSNCLLVVLSFLLFTSLTFSQSIPESVENDIYLFLNRLAAKGVIQFDDIVKPIPRKIIYKKLFESINNNLLSNLEKAELEFYLKEYGIEKDLIVNNNSTKRSNFFGKDYYDRYRLYSYSDNLFKVNVSPILGYETGTIDGSKSTHFWNGLRFEGYLSDFIGFNFSFRDNKETGDNIDRTKLFTNETGVVTSRVQKNSIEYSEVRTNISVDWDWGSATVGKDFIEWGYGESGKLVLSNKAPSFPFIRLDVYPTDWLHFNYIHAWLNSELIDSSTIYPTFLENSNRFLYEEKYLASHSLNLILTPTLNLSLGESIVYSDRLEIAYLMPFMFFRLADHYLSSASNDAGGNSQFFFSLSSRNFIPKTHLYSTLFIDEVTMTDIFDKEKQRTQVAYNIGASVVDLPINNLTLTAEFTKIYPFVYNHYIPTQTYTSNSYLLGDWMGHNADRIYGSLNYRIIRGLQAKVWMQYIRKGEDGEIEQQYKIPQPPFLFGLRKNYTWWGFDIKYEIIHELNARIKYASRKQSEQQTDGSFIDKKINEFSFALYYGL